MLIESFESCTLLQHPTPAKSQTDRFFLNHSAGLSRGTIVYATFRNRISRSVSRNTRESVA